MNEIADHFRSVQFSSWIWLIFLLILSSWSWVIVAHIFGLVQFILSSFKFTQLREKESLFLTQKPFVFPFLKTFILKNYFSTTDLSQLTKKFKMSFDLSLIYPLSYEKIMTTYDWLVIVNWTWVNLAHMFGN